MDIVPKRAPDSWLFCAVVALVATGVVMVYSASAIVAQDRYGDGAFFFKRQVAWAGLGMMALLIMQRTQYARLRRLTPWLLIMAILSLTLVLMPGIGRVAGGARRWIRGGCAAWGWGRAGRSSFTSPSATRTSSSRSSGKNSV